METAVVVLSAVCAVLFVLCVVFGVLAVRYGRKMNALLPDDEEQAAEVEIEDGVRYTKESAVTDAEGVNVTHHQGDVFLKRDKTYRADKAGELLPGAYTVLSAGGAASVKLRVGDRVREFAHGDRLVLGDGEEVTAVSADAILR